MGVRSIRIADLVSSGGGSPSPSEILAQIDDAPDGELPEVDLTIRECGEAAAAAICDFIGTIWDLVPAVDIVNADERIRAITPASREQILRLVDCADIEFNVTFNINT